MKRKLKEDRRKEIIPIIKNLLSQFGAEDLSNTFEMLNREQKKKELGSKTKDITNTLIIKNCGPGKISVEGMNLKQRILNQNDTLKVKPFPIQLISDRDEKSSYILNQRMSVFPSHALSLYLENSDGQEAILEGDVTRITPNIQGGITTIIEHGKLDSKRHKSKALFLYPDLLHKVRIEPGEYLHIFGIGFSIDKDFFLSSSEINVKEVQDAKLSKPSI